jgi:hypothetical protein
MRMTSLKALLGLLLLVFCTFSTRPASAQTFQIGTCAGAEAFTFTPGLASTPKAQNFTYQGIYTGCVYVANLLSAPVPAYATWNSSISSGGCLTLNTNPSPGSGTLTWTDKSTSTVVLTAAPVSIGIAGISPTAAIFSITSGTGAGGYFIINADLLPSVAEVTCSDAHPVYILTGVNVPTLVALPANLL